MSNLEKHHTLNKTQFEALFKLHFAHLCNFAVQFVNDMDTAQDICQKVFITLWEKREEMDTRKSIKSYLFTAVRNRCLNYIRDHKKYRSKVLDLDCGGIEISNQEDTLEAEDLQQKIGHALAQLPQKCRMAFEMSRFRAMKYKEIAEEMEISQKTVEAHISKAIKHLREHLKDYYLLLLLLFEGFN